MKITQDVHKDSRGLFLEAYKESEFTKVGIPIFVQDNISVSRRGVIRGLHYQKFPREQGKLVRCVSGAIFDVMVEISTGEIFAMYLSSDNHRMVYVPPGFAHGFQAMTENATVYYKCTSEYSVEHEAGIHPLDETLNIQWPDSSHLISDKDKLLPKFKEVNPQWKSRIQAGAVV